MSVVGQEREETVRNLAGHLSKAELFEPAAPQGYVTKRDSNVVLDIEI